MFFFKFKYCFFLDKFKNRASRITHDETQAYLLDLKNTFNVVELL